MAWDAYDRCVAEKALKGVCLASSNSAVAVRQAVV